MLAEVKYAFMSLDLQTQSCASFTTSSLFPSSLFPSYGIHPILLCKCYQ